MERQLDQPFGLAYKVERREDHDEREGQRWLVERPMAGYP